jgi:MFS family permease
VSSLFRHRDFVLLWSGQSVSELGSAVTIVAFPLVAVGALHASTFEVGLLTAATSIAWLMIGLPAGVWVDRLPRRPVLIGADLARALLMATVPLAWAVHVLTIGPLVVVAFTVGLLSVLFDVAYPAYLPSLITRDRLVEGNSALATSESAANVAGPSLGGTLVQLVGAPVALLADAASFAVSAASLAAIRSTETLPEQRSVRQPLGREIAAGLRYVRTHPLARSVAVTGTLANFVLGGYQAVIVVFLARQVGLAPALIGILFTLTGAGGMLGSLIAAPLARRVGNARVMCGAPIVMTVCGLLIPLTSKGTGVAWYIVGAPALSLGIAAFNVCVRAAMQTAAPDAMLGRVTASVRLFSRGAMPAGALGAGAVATLLTPRATLAILMGILAITPAWLLHSPIGRVRDVAELASPPASPIKQQTGPQPVTDHIGEVNPPEPAQSHSPSTPPA